MLRKSLLSIGVFLAASVCQAQLPRTVGGPNFGCRGPSRADSLRLLDHCIALRKEIALEWLGEELPPELGHASVRVIFDESRNDGVTITVPGSPPGRFLVSVYAPEPMALGPTLEHEMVHVVLGTRFGDALPAWANEGVASLRDDTLRKTRRAELLRKQRGLQLRSLLSADTIPRDDQLAYAISESLTNFLLTLGTKRQVLDFAVDGKQLGWDRALRKHYRIPSVEALQSQWLQWVAAASDRT
jgi:hypothetical protein